MSEETAYFIRESATSFRPTAHVSGGWNPAEQHIAPAIGLLAHAVERDFSERRPQERLQLIRLSVDILGVIPMEAVDLQLQVLRPGRTIELVEARLSHAGRAAVVARAWLAERYDTAAFAASALRPVPPRSELPDWHLNDTWPGGFVRSVQIRHRRGADGGVVFWLNSPLELIAGEEVSNTARVLGLVDVANGAAALVPPQELLYPNLDLTAHLFRAPLSSWVALDSAASIGPAGAGLTHSILHDEEGPIGSVAQTLTVRPRS